MSKFFNLNLADFGKGLLLAVIAVVLNGAYTLIADGGYGTAAEWSELLHTAVVTILAYLTKNLLTNSDGEIGSENK